MCDNNLFENEMIKSQFLKLSGELAKAYSNVDKEIAKAEIDEAIRAAKKKSNSPPPPTFLDTSPFHK